MVAGDQCGGRGELDDELGGLAQGGGLRDRAQMDRAVAVAPEVGGRQWGGAAERPDGLRLRRTHWSPQERLPGDVRGVCRGRHV